MEQEELPHDAQTLLSWPWEQIEPYFTGLIHRPLDAARVDTWLADWSQLASLINEAFTRLYVATTLDTTDAQATQRYQAFLDNIYPQSIAAEQKLKEKLLASGLKPAGFEIPLRNMRTEAELYREANLPLLVQERKFDNEYDEITGTQTVIWQDKEVTLPQLQPVYQEQDREVREQAWRLGLQRQLEDRQKINNLWVQYMNLRGRMAENAGLPSYRAYRWKQLLRFDYTPEDCLSFHEAIEQAVVPAARRIYERRRARLGVSALRPWDLDVDPLGLPPLKPFKTTRELEEASTRIFHHVDPQLGEHFERMRAENLLDLDNRKGKAPGGYCTDFTVLRRPFIFMNAVGIHQDVQTLLHEGGHAFHVFETRGLPYIQQLHVGAEFAEVASMGMELLAAPYLQASQGGFYSEAEAARARAEHLEEIVLFWPYMAVVDAFQHWVYTHHADASQPANCDAKWAELWDRFMLGVDWSGLEEEKKTGWHRKLHIHLDPFYYVEYGLAQLGAVQLWRNARQNQAEAVAAYRRALALGGTVPLPELYRAAGVRLAFDPVTLGEAVALAEQVIEELGEK